MRFPPAPAPPATPSQARSLPVTNAMMTKISTIMIVQEQQNSDDINKNAATYMTTKKDNND
jgi:hypothetical protein